MGTTSHTLKERAYRELKEFVVIALYLWVVFGLFLLYKSVILNEDIGYVAKGVALINALILAIGESSRLQIDFRAASVYCLALSLCAAWCFLSRVSSFMT